MHTRGQVGRDLALRVLDHPTPVLEKRLYAQGGAELEIPAVAFGLRSGPPENPAVQDLGPLLVR